MKRGIPFDPFSIAKVPCSWLRFILAVVLVPAYPWPQRSVSELETLVAPITLYPDPLLAQLLPAATYPGSGRGGGRIRGEERHGRGQRQGWDASVAATARYTEAIGLLGSDPVWTTIQRRRRR